MGSTGTAIISYGEVEREPKEIYGEGRLLLRIGNGGAGATGLLRALSEDYLSTVPPPEKGSIQWICNHSRNSQLALREGFVDIALTYERDQEELAERGGWARSVGCVFHDHFVIAGPVNDPANLGRAGSIEDALRKIHDERALWHSRNEYSATMFKERSLWAKVGLSPWEGKQDEGEWYKTSLCTPSEALPLADIDGAYLLTDRSTLLRQTALGTIRNTTVYFEPESGRSPLMNSCFGSVRKGLEDGESNEEAGTFLYEERNNEAELFVRYLKGKRAQELIARFGLEEVGLPFFASIAGGFAREQLRGRTSVQGRCVELKSSVQ